MITLTFVSNLCFSCVIWFIVFCHWFLLNCMSKEQDLYPTKYGTLDVGSQLCNTCVIGFSFHDIDLCFQTRWPCKHQTVDTSYWHTSSSFSTVSNTSTTGKAYVSIYLLTSVALADVFWVLNKTKRAITPYTP